MDVDSFFIGREVSHLMLYFLMDKVASEQGQKGKE
jgi:hypothetical protein